MICAKDGIQLKEQRQKAFTGILYRIEPAFSAATRDIYRWARSQFIPESGACFVASPTQVWPGLKKCVFEAAGVL